MKFKLWRRRRSVSSTRMTIATPWSWPARLAFVVALVVPSALGGIWAFEHSRAFAGVTVDDARRQLVDYRDQVGRLTAERDQLSATANAAESELNIERAAQYQLAAQLKVLESENARLKEDLAFFDSLLPSATGSQGIAIRRLKIDQVAPNQLRYRLLIMQGGKGNHFSGVLQFVITTVQDGKSAMMVFPEEDAGEPGRFKLGFKHYQRMEGVLTLPDGVTATMVAARVLEKGQVRAQTSVNL
jgi:hypothetical protein